MATAHQIRDLIAHTTTGTARHCVPREVRDEVYRYAVSSSEGRITTGAAPSAGPGLRRSSTR